MRGSLNRNPLIRIWALLVGVPVLLALVVLCSPLTQAVGTNVPVDFSGDGRSDWAVVRNVGGGPGGAVGWLIQTNNAAPSGTGAIAGTGGGNIPDGLAGQVCGAATVVSFAVTGLTQNVHSIEVGVDLTHSFVGDLNVVVAAPGGAPSFTLVSRIGKISTASFGDSSDYGGVYRFTDAAPSAPANNIWTVATAAGCGAACVIPAGDYRTTAATPAAGQPNPAPFTTLVSAFNGVTPAQANGTWTLSVTDCGSGDTGSVSAATSSLTVLTPTAAGSSIGGRITDQKGAPISGTVINLSGSQTRETITDANGYYQFGNVETNGFYTVTPSRANYNFTPLSRSFSQTGNQTDAAFAGSLIGDIHNPVDTAEYFVRQQYVDILGREPDEGGLNYWSSQILQCGANSGCLSARRHEVAAAFFMSDEFQQSGAYIFGVYAGALGRQPVFDEFAIDRQQVVGGGNLDTEKMNFARGFVERSEFISRYQSAPAADSFVDALIDSVQQGSGISLSDYRDSFITRYNGGGSQSESRALVVRDMADVGALRQAEHSRTFVLTEYYGYLRRNADQGGYDFWLNVLNHNAGDYHGMVCAFVTSTEYQNRFSSVVTRNNSECGE